MHVMGHATPRLVAAAAAAFRCNGLLLEDDGRPAHACAFEVETHLDAVSDSDKGNAAGHPIVLPVEGHGPGNRARPGPFALEGQVQGLGFGDAANGKRALDIKGLGAGRTIVVE